MNHPAETEAIRRALYVLFARLWAGPPDAPLYARLHEGGLRRLAAAQGVDLTSDLLDEDDAETSAAELQAEYARLAGAVSLRASDHGPATDDPVAAVSAFLTEHALRLDADAALPVDHLSVALGIMGELAAQGEAAQRAGDLEGAALARLRAQAFLRRHLLPWGASALADVAQHADRRFYRGLAAMLAAFLESERRLHDAA